MGPRRYHSFSFGDHYDPTNVSFGRLMVNNDDLVRVGAGYPDHPHRDAEIVTWVLSGSLVHEDSHGNSGLIYPGLAQRMSAGSGIVHAERNDALPHRSDAVRPSRCTSSRCGSDPTSPVPHRAISNSELALGDLAGDWVPIASGRHPDAVVSLGSAGSTLWVERPSGRDFAPAASGRSVACLSDAEELSTWRRSGGWNMGTRSGCQARPS